MIIGELTAEMFCTSSLSFMILRTEFLGSTMSAMALLFFLLLMLQAVLIESGLDEKAITAEADWDDGMNEMTL